MHKKYFSLLALLCFFAQVFSQNLKSPSDFLGYELGTAFSRHHQVVEYFKHVANSVPDQVQLVKYGETYERRPLYLAFLSSRENMAKIETIRQNNLRRAGVIEGTTENDQTAIVWLSYNVHGNEASSIEASMLTIYKLLTEKEEWLKNTIVIIDPCINPDGRDRYANWFNKTASMPYDIDQQASEHNEPWPGGRPNHYLFDLNRDWAWATQIESQSRIKVYNKWLPHIHVDFHEQGMNEPYYFAPAAQPYHEIISTWQRDFQVQIGKNNAKYFDANGWLFFTKERFDLFYPSYGDTYPTYMGAIGMTYEQGGHSRGGLGVLNDEGIVLTLIDRIAHHTTTGLSTVEISSQNADKLTTEFQRFFNSSGLKYKSYVMQGDADKIEALKALLDMHEIKYGHASRGKVSGYKYDNGLQGSMTTTNADLVVRTDQPKGKMVKVLFEPNAKLSDSLTYDITAWSMPYAYGLECIASTAIVGQVNANPQQTNNTVNRQATGYMTDWDSLKDAEFLAELLKQEFKVRFTEKPIQTDGKSFDRGSLILTRGDNPSKSDFDQELITIANRFSRKLDAIASGYSTQGPDFGSPDIKLVNRQRVAMLSGEGTSSLSYGALWHFFEQQLHYPVTSLNTDDFGNIDLAEYDILIMPSGNYRRLLNENNMKKLTDWVKAGGKVIAIDRALSSFAGKEGFGLKSNASDNQNDEANLIPYGDRRREFAKNLITGAVFETAIDNSHPMAFGYDTTYHSLKLGRSSYSLLKNGFNVAHIGSNPKNVSGFAGSEAIKSLPNSLVFGEERLGRGSMIYMVDNVMFRSFWENGKLFLVNSIFFVNNQAYRP
ncbi:MAG: zinc carboxypeptidase [Bacteroidia bacterium]|nr:zinc carboxypeptidase [Bacteroidia bacterium]